MVLAIVDDLMFAAKIKTAAQLGITVSFARSSGAAMAAIRDNRHLVILDLNNPRTDPLGTVAAIKGDPATRAIRTVGYASHVRPMSSMPRVWRGGRGDGRSAFTARLLRSCSRALKTLP